MEQQGYPDEKYLIFDIVTYEIPATNCYLSPKIWFNFLPSLYKFKSEKHNVIVVIVATRQCYFEASSSTSVYCRPKTMLR